MSRVREADPDRVKDATDRAAEVVLDAYRAPAWKRARVGARIPAWFMAGAICAGVAVGIVGAWFGWGCV